MKAKWVSAAACCLALQPAIRAQDAPGPEDQAKLDLLITLLNTKVEVASKELESASEAPGIVSVLTRDDLQRFGGTTLADVLNRVPGLLHVTSYFTERSWIVPAGDNIRSRTTSMHVLLLLNGRPLREVQEGGIKGDVYQTFPVEAIDHIEVIKGPGSVLYGSEAFSGVINVVTRKADTTGGVLAGSVASENGARQWGKLDVASGDFNLAASLQWTRQPDWNVNYGFSADPAGSTVLTVPYKLRNVGESIYVETHFKGISLTANTSTFETPYVIQDYTGDIGDVQFQRNFMNLGYSNRVSDRWKMDVNLTYNHSRLKVLTDTVPPVGRNSHEMLGEVTGSYYLDKGKLLFGALYSRASGTEKFISAAWNNATVSEGHRASRAFYAQADYALFETVKGTGGFQVLKVAEGKSTVVPRLGLIWSAQTAFNVKLLYGEAFRAPYINENFIDLAGRFKGSRTLKPEQVKSLQLGINYYGEAVEVSISAFHNKQNDLISYAGPDSDHLTYTNIGECTVQGMELEGKYYASKNFFFTGSMLFQRPGKGELTGYSNFGAKAGISYQNPYVTLSLFDVHQGAIDTALYNPASNNPKPESYDLLSIYMKANINAIFDLKITTHFEVFFQADNVLNKELWIVAAGDVNYPTSIPFNKGRTVFAGVKVHF